MSQLSTIPLTSFRFIVIRRNYFSVSACLSQISESSRSTRMSRMTSSTVKLKLFWSPRLIKGVEFVLFLCVVCHGPERIDAGIPWIGRSGSSALDTETSLASANCATDIQRTLLNHCWCFLWSMLSTWEVVSQLKSSPMSQREPCIGGSCPNDLTSASCNARGTCLMHATPQNLKATNINNYWKIPVDQDYPRLTKTKIWADLAVCLSGRLCSPERRQHTTFLQGLESSPQKKSDLTQWLVCL